MGDAQTPAHLCTRAYTQLVGTEKGMLATMLSSVVPVCEVNLAKFRSLSRFLPLFPALGLQREKNLIWERLKFETVPALHLVAKVQIVSWSYRCYVEQTDSYTGSNQ